MTRSPTWHSPNEADPAVAAAAWPRPQALAVRQLRVLTLNVHKGFDIGMRRFVLPELREAVRATRADLVFLQEIVGARLDGARRFPSWPATPQYEFLADQIWSDYAYGRNAVNTGGHHGNAVLSRYPIKRWDNVDVSVGSRQEPRALLHCEIDLHGRELHAVCVHLGLRAAHRGRQLRALCELLARTVPEGAPLVVAGDFNDWRGRAHRALAECRGLQEVFVAHRGRAARTFPAVFPLLRLDRIYVSGLKAFEPLPLPAHPWSRLSDHAPLMARLNP